MFQDRSAGFYIGVIASLAALGTAVAYFVLDRGDKTYSALAFALTLLAGAAGLAAAFTRWKLLPLLPPILMGGAVGCHLYVSFPSITDLINRIVFIGGNSMLAVQFAVCFGAVGLLFALASFFPAARQDMGK